MLSRLSRFAVILSVLSLSTILCAQAAAGQALSHASRPLDDPAIERKVDALLRQMTLEEKVGQLAQYSAGQPTGPGTGMTDYNDMIGKGEMGALFNVVTARETNAYQHIAVQKTRLHIPLIFGLDVIHGFRTEFPIPLGLASTWDPALVQKAARVAATEASATGIRWTFSPMVDIARDARWGRMSEGAGEDPFLGAVMAQAYVRGYQGDYLSSPDSIAACLKHYVGYGAAEAGRDYNTTEISEHTLRQFYLVPFHAGVEAGSATIMSAFNSLNGIPASSNPFTLTQVLRKEWGFKGIVDSDWTSILETIAHGIANDGATAASKSIIAGVDMDMASNLYHQNMAELVRSGKVPQATLDEAVRRVLRVKFALGLFDHPYVDEQAEAAAMLHPDYVELARKAAEKSFVLLKNDTVGGSPLLPIAAGDKKIALIGPLADDPANMLGSWGAQGKAEDAAALRAVLAARVGSDHVFYAKGGGIQKSTDEEIAEAVTAAKQSDLVILALGEDAGWMTGEAASRTKLGLPGRQQELLEAVAGTGKPVVLIVFSGRPLTLPWAFEHVPAVLAAWFPGVQAGPALVRTLFGEANPSGRLVVSWPRSVGQEPLYYNALNTGRPASKVDLTHRPDNGDDKYVSRYIDELNSPQYPFGYGLSYTSVQYGPVETSTKQLQAGDLTVALAKGAKAGLMVAATVTNSGTRATEETVQAYVRLQGTSTVQPVRALKGFQKIALAPGESKKVTFELGPDAFALWDDHNHYTVEPARATVWVSPDAVRGEGVTVEIVP